MWTRNLSSQSFHFPSYFCALYYIGIKLFVNLILQKKGIPLFENILGTQSSMGHNIDTFVSFCVLVDV